MEFENHGRETLFRSQISHWAPSGEGAKAVDLNGDGDDELILTPSDLYNQATVADDSVRVLDLQADNFVEITDSVFAGDDAQNIQFVNVTLIEDFTGNGRLDMFMADHGYETGTDTWSAPLRYWTQNHNAQFQYAPEKMPDIDSFWHWADAGDLDVDGDIDIIASNLISDDAEQNFQILLNNGNGAFSAKNDLEFLDAQIAGGGVHIANFDSDPEPEIIALPYENIFWETDQWGPRYLDRTTEGSYEVRDILDKPDSVRKIETHDWGATYSQGHGDSKSSDIDGDGDLDLVLNWEGGGANGDRLIQYFENVDGNLEHRPLAFSGANLEALARRGGESLVTLRSNQFELADFNLDGYTDILMKVGYSKDDPLDLKNMILLNDGNGKFSTNHDLDPNAPVKHSSGYNELMAGDFNGDGVADLANIISSAAEGDFHEAAEDSFVSAEFIEGQQQIWTGDDTANRYELGGREGGTLTAQDGDDTIIGGAGIDEIYGNLGNDRLRGQDGDDLLFGGQNGGEPTLDRWGRLKQQQGVETLAGGDGDDLIYGNFGAEELYGGLGDDTMFGGQGNDTMFGAAGSENLWGGTGNDVMTGGGGANTFYLDGGGSDRIVDFNADEGDLFGSFRGFDSYEVVGHPDGLAVLWTLDGQEEKVVIESQSSDDFSADWLLA
jgi:hypothetical protein